MWTDYIFFSIIYIYFANWGRFKLLTRAFKPKSLIPFDNSSFTNRISKKIKLPVKIFIQTSPRIFGYMPGIPIKPVIVISHGALESLTESELEWLVLHEAGHCIYWHTVKSSLIQILIFLLGLFITRYIMSSYLLIFGTALALAIIWYQIERIFEFQADTFSLYRMDDVKGMISANEKMKSKVTSIFYRNNLLTLLFTPHLTYDQRIRLARNYRVK